VIHEEQGVAMEEDGGHTLISKRPNLVLQYIEHDKPEVLRKEITFEELQQYGFCLFTALAHLHKQGIVHRDVKPGNFLFSRKQRLGYLVDFNLAMVVSKSGRSRRGEVIRESSTAIGKVLGKRPCKDTSESCPSKRQQTISRETMLPCERKHKLQQTAIIIPKVSVAEERQMLGDDNTCKKSVAADSSSKAAVVLNSHAAPAPSGSQEAQLSSKPAVHP
jgi:serine/threonine protein kinase